VGYESIINIRPAVKNGVGNRSMEIQDPALREQVNQIVQSLLGKVQWQ
jgi:hypothetical protein